MRHPAGLHIGAGAYATLAIGVLVAAFAPAARAQGVPFFAPGATAFSPEISVVNSGIVQDVQATVSPDRRYVTLGMRAQNSQLLALKEFSFQNPTGAAGAGFVGGAVVEPTTGALGGVNEPMLIGVGRGAGLLRQRGMTPLRSR